MEQGAGRSLVWLCVIAAPPSDTTVYCRVRDSQWQGRRVIRKLSFTKFPHEIIFCGNLTSPAHNYGLLRLDYDEIFKVSLLIRKNLLESAKRLCLTLHIEHQYHLIHQRAIRISKQNTKVQTAKTDCAIAWSKVCLRNLTPRKYYRKTGTGKVF